MTSRMESITVIRQEIREIIGNLIVDLPSMLKRKVSLLTTGQMVSRLLPLVKWSTDQLFRNGHF